MSEGLLTFLETAGSGCISGRVSEWPQLVPACRWAAEQLSAHQPGGMSAKEAALKCAEICEEAYTHAWSTDGSGMAGRLRAEIRAFASTLESNNEAQGGDDHRTPQEQINRSLRRGEHVAKGAAHPQNADESAAQQPEVDGASTGRATALDRSTVAAAGQSPGELAKELPYLLEYSGSDDSYQQRCLEQASSTIKDLQEALARAQERITQLSNKYEALSTSYSELDDDLERTESDLARTKAELQHLADVCHIEIERRMMLEADLARIADSSPPEADQEAWALVNAARKSLGRPQQIVNPPKGWTP